MMELRTLPDGHEVVRLSLAEWMGWCGVPKKLQGLSWATWWAACKARPELGKAVRARLAQLREFEKWSHKDGVWCYMLSGPCGTGKSGLAAAQVSRFYGSETRPRWENWGRLVADVADSWKAGGERIIVDEVTRARFLVLDDLGSEGTREMDEAHPWQRRVAYEIINVRYERGHPTIVTTQLSPDEVSQRYDDRIMSRLGEGLGIDLSGFPDLRRRIR